MSEGNLAIETVRSGIDYKHAQIDIRCEKSEIAATMCLCRKQNIDIWTLVERSS